jgi:urease beta subunit
MGDKGTGSKATRQKKGKSGARLKSVSHKDTETLRGKSKTVNLLNLTGMDRIKGIKSRIKDDKTPRGKSKNGKSFGT